MKGYSKMGHGIADSPSKPAGSEGASSFPENPNLDFSIKREQRSGTAALRRSRSSASQRFSGAEEKGKAALPAAVRQALSLRRSSSVANGYWRIHDGGDKFSPEDEDEEVEPKQRRGMKKKKGSWRKGLVGFCKKLARF
ncbi:hypothetical protein AXF42_Ash002251 [Apostasia shenzhenica]|uniref:Uncharacterized protein n=1 Tax=Apostasia shenzhenica TaxID=1088818 RepID=A0A2I0AMZ9_9ASPA|nr:hypothetical protein AXF42_Ash002251 [Apostasia shenzhenica]